MLPRQDEGKTDIHTSFEGHQRVEVSVYIFDNKVGFRSIEYKLGHYRNITLLEVGLRILKDNSVDSSFSKKRPHKSKLGMLHMTYFTVSLTSIRIILCLK